MHSSQTVRYSLLKWLNRLRHNSLRTLGLYEPITQTRYRLTAPSIITNSRPKVVVSLKSYPPRFQQLHYTLMSLVSQRVKPDRIRLNLDEGTTKLLPEKCHEIIRRHSIETREITIPMRSYGKLIPTLADYPHSTIITADDDVYYPRDWTKVLLGAHKQFRGHTIGYRAHKIEFDSSGKPLPYSQWKTSLRQPACGPNIMLTGVSGILYPVDSLPPEAMRSNRFLELAPTADDLWLWRMTLLAGYTPMKIGPKDYNYAWQNNGSQNLSDINVAGHGNDYALSSLLSSYPLSIKEDERKK